MRDDCLAGADWLMLNVACPGILPRDGRNISYVEMGKKIQETYNFAPTFCYYVPNYMANLLGRSYKYDTIDLSDFNVHNGIEHDASLCRKLFESVLLNPTNELP